MAMDSKEVYMLPPSAHSQLQSRDLQQFVSGPETGSSTESSEDAGPLKPDISATSTV